MLHHLRLIQHLQPDALFTDIQKSQHSVLLEKYLNSSDILYLKIINKLKNMLKNIYYATKQQNTKLDQLLMGKYSYLSETLMELAGIAVAQAIHQVNIQQNKNIKRIAVLVGPGNNGGDGLVAGRHLKLMNYDINIYLFKKLQGKNANFMKLCTNFEIPHFYVDEKFPIQKEDSKGRFVEEMKKHDLVIDALFGFPFQGEFRQPYKTFIPELKHVEDKIFAVDIPSGWDANDGNIKNLFYPKYLISLGLAKKFSKEFKGRHFMGGRFIPPILQEQIGVVAPKYQGSKLYMEIKQQ